MRLRRMWINQPSTLQEFHSLHGTNVLVDLEDSGGPCIYFLSGAVISMLVNPGILSAGWPRRTETNERIRGELPTRLWTL